jgi:hypothetical protein
VEDPGANQHVYLASVSRVLPETLAATDLCDITVITRQQIGEMFLDAVNNPAIQGAGRPRKDDVGRVEKIVVFKELHEDGTPHFHVAIKLRWNMRFAAVEKTLRSRHKLPSHWSCSHRLFCSAVRYGHIPSEKKPVVDTEPWQWTASGKELDLFAESQDPYNAEAQRKRREKKDADAIAQGRRATFGKFDLNNVILSKHLHTKAALLAYVQDYGTAAMQSYVSNNQGELNQIIKEAQEWEDAKRAARKEAQTDWELLVEASEQNCTHGPSCSYAQAAKTIFAENSGTVSQTKLAAALRDIIQNGPKKTCRVPFLVGPSNCGKSTLLYPFDDLYGPKNVLHKPALGSGCGSLRNITSKRFLFWDDFRPVEYAHEKTVTVSTFLSLFIGKHAEIQVSQSFSDGNIDVQWQRGCVFTAKKLGLWAATKNVSDEDVRHLRNRVEEFEFTEVVSALHDVESCAPCMAKWIIKGASDHDLSSGLPISTTSGASSGATAITGFHELMREVHLPQEFSKVCHAEILELGAVDVKELATDDWEALSCWHMLRRFEQRRLLKSLA